MASLYHKGGAFVFSLRGLNFALSPLVLIRLIKSGLRKKLQYLFHIGIRRFDKSVFLIEADIL